MEPVAQSQLQIHWSMGEVMTHYVLQATSSSGMRSIPLAIREAMRAVASRPVNC